MTSIDKFQGVVCCCLNPGSKIQNNILKLLDLKNATAHQNIPCFSLALKNKYYETTVHLFDFEELPTEDGGSRVLDDCQAIILHANGQTLTTDLLDDKVSQLGFVGGEPRLLICDGIDEDCPSYRTFLDWSIKNGYDFLLPSDEDIKNQMIDSLSAYKWIHRSDDNINDGTEESPQLSRDLLKKLVDFDSLLGKLSAYRDKPELRGNPDDKNIEEIAEILSGLLGDDVDDFLANESLSTTITKGSESDDRDKCDGDSTQ